jgi:hypothetical protein
MHSGVDSGGAGGARAPPEFGSSEKRRSLIFAYRSFAITASTFGFKKNYLRHLTAKYTFKIKNLRTSHQVLKASNMVAAKSQNAGDWKFFFFQIHI